MTTMLIVLSLSLLALLLDVLHHFNVLPACVWSGYAWFSDRLHWVVSFDETCAAEKARLERLRMHH